MGEVIEIQVPDIGDFEAVDVIEVLVSPGDEVEREDPLITLESDKASMDIPSPRAGAVREIRVSAGDQVSEGAVILTLEVEEKKKDTKEKGQWEEKEKGDGEVGDKGKATKESTAEPEREAPPSPPRQAAGAGAEIGDERAFRNAYASPAVRRFARELGVDLSRVGGSGRKGRILKGDVQTFVKAALGKAPAAGPEGAFALPPMPEIDFAKFGEVERQPLPRIRRVSARNLHRSWLHVPLVTQFDEADITELEAFRKAESEEAKRRGVKLTPLAFIMKAAVASLREFPEVNSSLAPGGEELILKRYYHLGIAVDTEQGLVVPVIRDVDRKSVYELAAELGEVSARARERKLKPEDLQGGTFSISSLGGLGGTAFTPLVNAPEVAILGVARAGMKPVYRDGEFVPRLILPFGLSYDHRVVDGAQAVRFTTHLARVLSDIRRLLL